MSKHSDKINLFFSLSTRFFTAFFILVILFSGVQIYTVIKLQSAVDELQMLNNFHLRFLFQAYGFENKHNLLLQFLKTMKSTEFVSKRNPVLLRRWFKLTFENRFKSYRKLEKIYISQFKVLPPEEKGFTRDNIKALMASISSKLDRDKKEFYNLINSDESFKNVDFKSLYRREQLLMSSIKHLIHISRNRVRRIAGKLNQTEQIQVKQQLILITGALLLSVIIILLSGKPLKSLAKLTEGAKKIGKGHFSHRISVKTNDEIGLLAKEFNSMAAAIEEREARLIRTERLATAGKLIAQIAHEIRNPLAAVSFQVELVHDLISDLDIPANTKEEITDIINALQNEVERLVRVTNDSLQFARLPKPDVKEIDLNDFISEFLDFISADLNLTDISVEVSLPEKSKKVSFDEDLMKQVIINLLKNASEAVSEGGKIEVSVVYDKNTASIKVSDNGKGISDEDKDKIFEAFYTDKEHGTGLGLALSLEIVHEHGGNIRVSDKTGGGTVFTVELPLN